VIGCAPTTSEETDSVAFPPAIVEAPRIVVASLNCTVPVAELGVTVAVKVTACPTVEAFCEEVTATLDPAWLTVWVKTDEALAVSFASPP
jgi:hypothetical protein